MGNFLLIHMVISTWEDADYPYMLHHDPNVGVMACVTFLYFPTVEASWCVWYSVYVWVFVCDTFKWYIHPLFVFASVCVWEWVWECLCVFAYVALCVLLCICTHVWLCTACSGVTVVISTNEELSRIYSHHQTHQNAVALCVCIATALMFILLLGTFAWYTLLHIAFSSLR